MKNNKRKIIPILAVVISLIASFSLGYNIKTKDNYAKSIDKKESIEITTSDTEYNGKKPKYIFLFIGDGMSYSQLQLADYYLKETGNNGLDILKLSTNGTMQNPDKTSLIPDSASTATAMATGEKTKSGNINVSEDGKEKYETITQKLKKDGYKIGIATTVNINHATPAGFSAHRESRKGYYEIGKEMLNTEFDYFAGGDFKDKKGENGDKKSLEKIAEEKGYTVADSEEEFEKLGNNSKEENSSNDEKYLVISDDREKTDAMKYSIDKRYEQENGEDKSDSLSDYVKKGIELLSDKDKKDKGFFMMVEGGKIDWACHKNDAASALHETIDLDNAVDEALKFYNNHKDETLIIVTGDHETGGLAIGNSNSEYDTHLENLGLQKISCDRFNEEYVSKYIKEKTDFREVLKDIEYVFGLKKPLVFKEEKAKEDSDDDHKHSDENSLELSKSEYERLKKAYDLTLENRKNRTKEESILYGSYKPITVEATRILAEKSGVAFTSFSHTAAPMAGFAEGVGASEFDGVYDNTELYEKLIEVIY